MLHLNEILTRHCFPNRVEKLDKKINKLHCHGADRIILKMQLILPVHKQNGGMAAGPVRGSIIGWVEFFFFLTSCLLVVDVKCVWVAGGCRVMGVGGGEGVGADRL